MSTGSEGTGSALARSSPSTTGWAPTSVCSQRLGRMPQGWSGPLSYSGGAFVDDLTAGDGHVDVHVGHQPVAGGEQVAVKQGQVAAVADL
jgi:hypothetical protein